MSLMVGLSACGFKPLPTHFEYPKTNNPLYQKAWVEGCESGFSVYGNSYWRSFYTYRIDVRLMSQNRFYSRVWWDSFNYCRHYLNRYLQDGFWGNEGAGSGSAANFNQDLRNSKPIEGGGFAPPLWDGIDIVGWGDKSDGESDLRWLGGGKTNALGQPVNNLPSSYDF